MDTEYEWIDTRPFVTVDEFDQAVRRRPGFCLHPIYRKPELICAVLSLAEFRVDSISQKVASVISWANRVITPDRRSKRKRITPDSDEEDDDDKEEEKKKEERQSCRGAPIFSFNNLDDLRRAYAQDAAEASDICRIICTLRLCEDGSPYGEVGTQSTDEEEQEEILPTVGDESKHDLVFLRAAVYHIACLRRHETPSDIPLQGCLLALALPRRRETRQGDADPVAARTRHLCYLAALASRLGDVEALFSIVAVLCAFGHTREVPSSKKTVSTRLRAVVQAAFDLVDRSIEELSFAFGYPADFVADISARCQGLDANDSPMHLVVKSFTALASHTSGGRAVSPLASLASQHFAHAASRLLHSASFEPDERRVSQSLWPLVKILSAAVPCQRHAVAVGVQPPGPILTSGLCRAIEKASTTQVLGRNGAQTNIRGLVSEAVVTRLWLSAKARLHSNGQAKPWDGFGGPHRPHVPDDSLSGHGDDFYGAFMESARLDPRLWSVLSSSDDPKELVVMIDQVASILTLSQPMRGTDCLGSALPAVRHYVDAACGLLLHDLASATPKWTSGVFLKALADHAPGLLKHYQAYAQKLQ
ncbi:Cell division cycle protein [Mollivirus sibericum]|uniref:Cell division cycle protein n=1 Tax=Mollivirus sibericum TaxID=1678078 RepID=UPI0006B2E653|nr:Cell division cycle protein [Mollivirus sibericum]ALD62260.1 Cell division cycle protein [Mollivirus sibericum]